MSTQITGNSSIILGSSAKAGTPAAVSTGWHNELLGSDLLPRYAYLSLAGTIFSVSTAGAGQAQAAANLFSTAIATSQPIVGVYNPLTSTKNAIILKGYIGITAYPINATNPGGFVWQVASGQLITQAGTAPINHTTLKASGSSMTGLVNQALTGATGSLIVLRPAPADNPNAVQIGALAGDTPAYQMIEEQIEGGIIVPPGGFLGLYNGLTGTTSTFSAGLTWVELPI